MILMDDPRSLSVQSFLSLRVLVMNDQIVRRLKDNTAGTVVFLQFDLFSLGKFLLKQQKVLVVRSAPTVNALIIIPYDAKVPAFLR
jgi:hypothetical protein